ncbi:MAG: DNA-processing protein DprA [Chitinophagaceae bacterium]
MSIQLEEKALRLALSKAKGIGPSKYRMLLDTFGSAQHLISSSVKQLCQLSGITKTIAEELQKINPNTVENELNHYQKNQIHILEITEDRYPTRLKSCNDAPPFIFFKGNLEALTKKQIAFVGTRKNSEYGKKVTENLIEELSAFDVNIISGLAFGIDSIAHKKALACNMSTVGILAHGIDNLYPPEHSHMAKEMQTQGGLCTEYSWGTKPEKGNFPTRNRIIAGLADATIVVETDIRGGSMITAELAYSYNRDLFAIPGRLYETKSAGTNHLIKSLKAQMVTHVDDIAISMGWKSKKNKKSNQRALFTNLNETEEKIYKALLTFEQLHIDVLMQETALNSTQLAGSLLQLEMQNIIKVLPGKLITLA